jgi:hypothetical protein
MPKDMKEPQSYGSEKDWVTGKTGNEVNDQDSAPPPAQQEFYDDRRESESSDSYSGGKTSPVQVAENLAAARNTPGDAVPRDEGAREIDGSRKESYFKQRDYE